MWRKSCRRRSSSTRSPTHDDRYDCQYPAIQPMRPITTNTHTITTSAVTLPSEMPSSIATCASAGPASPAAVTTSMRMIVQITRRRYGRKYGSRRRMLRRGRRLTRGSSSSSRTGPSMPPACPCPTGRDPIRRRSRRVHRAGRGPDRESRGTANYWHTARRGCRAPRCDRRPPARSPRPD